MPSDNTPTFVDEPEEDLTDATEALTQLLGVRCLNMEQDLTTLAVELGAVVPAMGVFFVFLILSIIEPEGFHPQGCLRLLITSEALYAVIVWTLFNRLSMRMPPDLRPVQVVLLASAAVVGVGVVFAVVAIEWAVLVG